MTRLNTRNSNFLALIGLFFLVSFCPFAGVHAVVTPGEVTFAMVTEPPNLDHTRATDSESGMILGHTMEGLTRLDASGKNVPAVAESWDAKDTSVTFKLRKNAKWSDGKPVTAHDFVFAWRRVIDPQTASEYAFILYYLKNGEAINKKKMSTDKLGVEAIDDHTLKVTFEKPCGYFVSLTNFWVLSPIREDFAKAQGEKYGANAANLLANGPFKLTKWVHGASLRLEKNDQYWNKDAIKLKAINVPYILPEDTARFNLFKDKKIDFVQLSKDTLPSAQKEKMKINKFVEGTMFYMAFNMRDGRITRNKNLRLAIKNLINNAEYISRVVNVPGSQEGIGLIPTWMMGEKTLFRKEFPLKPYRPNFAEAKKYMELARKELKNPGPISIVWLTNDSPLSKYESEYFQGLFKTQLNIDLKIDVQIFKQRLAKTHAGDFDIVAAGWGPDYNDPMTYADLFASWNGNNNGRWKNDEYDRLIRIAQTSTKPRERMEAMAKAEKILLDDAGMIPTYERTRMFLTSPRLSGVIRQRVGTDPDFTFAVSK